MARVLSLTPYRLYTLEIEKGNEKSCAAGLLVFNKSSPPPLAIYCCLQREREKERERERGKERERLRKRESERGEKTAS